MRRLLSKPASAAHGVIFLSAAQAGVVVMGYAIHCIATRWLPEAEYGRLVVTLSVLTWINTFMSIAFLQGLQKVLTEDHARLATSISIGRTWYALLVVVTAGGLLVAAWPLAVYFGDHGILPLLLLAGCQIPVMGLFLLTRGHLTSLRRYGLSAMLHTTYGLVRAAVACGLLLLGVGAVGVIVGNIAGLCLAGLAGLWLLLHLRRLIPSVPYPPMLRRALRWSAMALPTTLAIATLATVDLWLVKRLVPDKSQAGFYGAALTLAALPRFLAAGLYVAVFPRVSQALAEGRNALARSISTESMRVLLILFVLICSLAASSASQITSLLFSARYACAGPPLALLTIAISCDAGLRLMQVLIAAANRPGARMVLAVSLVPLAVGLHLVLIPRFGLMGAASVTLATLAVGLVVGTVLVYRFVGAAPPFASALRCVSAGVAVYILGRYWHVAGWWLLGKLFLLGILYVVLLLVLRELRSKDLLAIKRTVLPKSA